MASVRPTHWVLLATAVGGVSFSAILVRWAEAEDVPSLVMSFYRLLFATAMLLPFTVRSIRREGWSVDRVDLGLMAGTGLLLAAHFATWVTSLEYTSVASSVVIVCTEALWVPLGAAFLLRERVAARTWAGVLLAFGGSIVLVAGDLGETRFGGKALVGDFLAFAGSIAASLYFLAGRRIRQRHALPVYATIVYAFASLFLLAMVLVQDRPLAPYSPRAFGVLFLFAFFPMIVGHTLINYLLRWVPPHYISTGILAEPVVSALLALVLWSEAVRPLVLLGGVVIIVGIAVALGRTSSEPVAASAAPST